MGLRYQGKHLPLEGGVAGDVSQGGNPMRRKARSALTSVGIWDCLVSVPHVRCVSSTFIMLTHMQHHMMGDAQTKSCLSTSGAKRANILRLALRDDATSRHLCSLRTGWWGRRRRRQLSNWLLPCLTNGAGNTRQHVGMSGSVSPWTTCGPSACWCRGHRVASPG